MEQQPKQINWGQKCRFLFKGNNLRLLIYIKQKELFVEKKEQYINKQ